ncbi:GNAT family N-acetyltransferase [Marinicrinis lubricantis]|uniref:GNAT family N-acetyltransferase n=1 Tax=Marinicrinis lubricantis TaxID=2086470 RepID=A0ABW1IKQ4_9BACL
MNIRLAEKADIDQLICMRWDFTYEHKPALKASYEPFDAECRTFLEEAISGNQWFIWVADIDGTIVSHIYIERIEKVPRPGRITHPFVYMTNVYTIPSCRSKGIGSKLLQHVKKWGREQRFEFMIVWPSDDAISFYRRNGFDHCKEPMEFMYMNDEG